MRIRESTIGLLLALPSFFWVFAWIIYPLLLTFYLSFYDVMLTGPGAVEAEFIGLGNYLTIFFEDIDFKAALINSVLWTIGNFVIAGFFGLGVALLLKARFKGNSILRTLILIPWVIPTVAIAITWKWLLNSELGIIQRFMLISGLISSSVPFFGPKYSLLTVTLVNVWRFTPFVTLVILARLESIPEELYEAARVDGASMLQQFTHITMPLLKPVLAVLGIIGVLWTFGHFDIVWLITKGGPGNSSMTLPVLVWMKAFYVFRLGEAASISTIMIAVLLAFTAFYFKFVMRGE